MEGWVSVQRGLFDLDERYAALSAAGDPLEKLGALIDFELFRPDLDAALQGSDGSKGGRRPLDAGMMFKVLVVQPHLALPDAQYVFQLSARPTSRLRRGLEDRGKQPH